MYLRIIGCSFVLFIASHINAQIIHALTEFPLPAALKESSGLVCVDTILYSHNDGGNGPVLYKLSAKGKLIDSIKVNGVVNNDWEDISFNNNQFYIAETGNNFQNRKDLIIYTLDENRLLIKTSPFSYGRQKMFPPVNSQRHYDCEAIQVLNDTAYMFSKDWSQPYKGITYAYILPLTINSPQSLVPVDSFRTIKNDYLDGSITSCCISPGRKYFVLMSCNSMYVFFNFRKNHFLQGDYAIFNFGKTSQRESIAFSSDSTFYVTDERWANMVGGNLYSYNLAPFMDGRIPYTASDIDAVFIRSAGEKKVNIRVQCHLYTDTREKRESLPDTDSLRIELTDASNQMIHKTYATRESLGAFSVEVDLKALQATPAVIRVFNKKQLVYCRSW